MIDWDTQPSFTKRVLDRDGWRCLVCGETEGVTCHHIKTRGSGGKDEMSNGITLCMVHHAQVHHGYLECWGTRIVGAEAIRVYLRGILRGKYRYEEGA